MHRCSVYSALLKEEKAEEDEEEGEVVRHS